MQKPTIKERQQIARQAECVARMLRTQETDEIPVGILSRLYSDMVTDGMIQKFWDAVDNIKTPRELFKTYARAAVKHKLLTITYGSAFCGGGFGCDFLKVPPDFSERVEHFLNPGKKVNAKQKAYRDPLQQRLFG